MGIIVKPLVTEKMTAITEKTNRFGFIVRPEANKLEIKKEVEALYNVTVVEVNTMRYSGKNKSRYTRSGLINGRTNAYKKAIVTLKEGDTIGYNKYLDEILILLRTEFKKNEHFCDSFMIYGYEDCLYNEDCNIKISFYTMYYEMLRFRYGVDTIEKIFQEKKKAYYWSDETYNEIFKCVSSNQTFSINIYS